MNNLLGGDIALVTGAGRGLGRAVAQAFAEAGAQVGVADLDQESAENVAMEIRSGGGNAISLAFDVTDPDACETAADEVRRRLGAVSVLVNSAGLLYRDDIDSDDLIWKFARHQDVNVNGIVNVVRACRHQLRENKGRVINMASITSFQASANALGYVASKGAVAQLTKALAADLAPYGVRVNALAPGRIETEMTAAYRDLAEVKSAYMARILIKRYGKPQDIMGPAVFLASGMSDYVTGTILPVDGGFLAI